jgi:hypothetical protein
MAGFMPAIHVFLATLRQDVGRASARLIRPRLALMRWI